MPARDFPSPRRTVLFLAVTAALAVVLWVIRWDSGKAQYMGDSFNYTFRAFQLAGFSNVDAGHHAARLTCRWLHHRVDVARFLHGDPCARDHAARRGAYVLIFRDRVGFPLLADALRPLFGDGAFAVATALCATAAAVALACLARLARYGAGVALTAGALLFAVRDATWLERVGTEAPALAGLLGCACALILIRRSRRSGWLIGVTSLIWLMAVRPSTAVQFSLAVVLIYGAAAVVRRRRAHTLLAITGAGTLAVELLVMRVLRSPGLSASLTDTFTHHYLIHEQRSLAADYLLLAGRTTTSLIHGFSHHPLVPLLALCGAAVAITDRALRLPALTVVTVSLMSAVAHPVFTELPRLLSPATSVEAVGLAILAGRLVTRGRAAVSRAQRPRTEPAHRALATNTGPQRAHHTSEVNAVSEPTTRPDGPARPPRRRLLLGCALVAALTTACTPGVSHSSAAASPNGPRIRPTASSVGNRVAASIGNAPIGALTDASPGCGSRLSRSREGAAPLRRAPDGALVFTYASTPELVRANAGDAATRWAGDPLPPPPDGRPTVIFYTPHPDDETLSAGVLLAQDAARGARVIIVALTEGADTRAIGPVNRRLRAAFKATNASANTAFAPLTPSDIGAARIRELRAAAAALGVSAQDVYTAHLDAPTSDCGDVVSVHEADQVIRAFAARYPLATHVTMSYDAERQQDHLAAGVALRTLTSAGTVKRAEFVVSRLWWTLPSPSWKWLRATDPGEPARVAPAVRAAVAAYERWDPSRSLYGIGGLSVMPQFRALLLDQRNRVHTLGAAMPGDSSPGL